jgi:hypothetical protein
MSLIGGKRIAIGRAERILRDDRFFVVAAEDTYAPDQYFAGLAFPRVKVLLIPTLGESGLSAPIHVVTRLKEASDLLRQRGEIQVDDEFWVMLDTDHHFQPNHIKGTLIALKLARDAGFLIAVSNPCFEVWLLLHHEDLSSEVVFAKPVDVENRLRQVLGSYNKSAIATEQFTMERIAAAIRRARALESKPNNPEGLWPTGTGTRVYRLMERVMGGTLS